jgi:hypothetical protein
VFATGPSDRFRSVARTIFGEDLPAVEQATMRTAASARPE